MTSRLIRADGSIARTWATDDITAALTADRNAPAGWWVEIQP